MSSSSGLDPLFERSTATLIRSWAYLAGGSPGAEVIEIEGATIAAFVHSPDRNFLNNTLLAGGAGDLAKPLKVVERTYAERGIERFAVWVHESEVDAGRQLEARGYAYDSSTRTMALAVEELGEADASVLDLVEPSPAQFWRAAEVEGLAPGLSQEVRTSTSPASKAKMPRP